jgi:phosphatidylserine/phosphatidylglycerophosphate/cardiolipin synthase-like enzyme
MKTFFLRPNNDSISAQVKREIISIIESSHICKIAVAYFTEMEIAKKLIERASFGYSTQLIINLSDILRPTADNISKFVFSSAVAELLKYYPKQAETDAYHLQIKTLGVQLDTNCKYTVFHHKFIVNDKVCGFGSLNFTNNAFINNYEDFHISDDLKTVSQFINEFDEMWEIAEAMYTQDGKIQVYRVQIVVHQRE